MLFESPLRMKEHRSEDSRPLFTDEFTYVLLAQVALVIITITDKKNHRTGYMKDITDGIEKNLPDVTSVQIHGPFHLIDRNGDIKMEETIVKRYDPRTKKMVEEPQNYAARCFIMIPHLDELEKFNIESIEKQITKLSTYCNENYAPNYMRFIKENNKSYGLKARSFGLAKAGHKVDKEGGISDYVSREHCTNFILEILNRRENFYSREKELAEKLIKPPYGGHEQKALGYPRY